MKKESRIFNYKKLGKLSLLFVLLFIFYLPVFASESNVRDDVKGIWIKPNEAEEPSFEWKAAWIWADEKLDEKAILARRTLKLNSVPEKAMLRITASSQYQLFINGEYVCRGPARSAPHHQSYDILDISKMLQRGENLIAVRVHHKDGKRSYQYEGRAGLLAQLDIDDKQTILTSNSEWKVLTDPSWDNNAPLISRFHQVVNDRVDFRNYPNAWEAPNFDDSNWASATELMRKHGWPSPQKNAKAQPLTPPWTSLVPRDIPYLIEKDIKAEKLIEAVQINVPITKSTHRLTGEIKLNGKKDEALELPGCIGSNSWLLVYDFGETINGMPKLDIQGTAGTEVEIVSAPFIVDKTFTHITVDSEFRDKIILSGERNKWEATYFKPTRYLGIIVKNDEPVKLYSAGIHEIEYPYELKGEISSSDAPWIEAYMNASAKTINVTTTDAITDNYRERRQYAQTAYYAMLGSYYIYDNLELQRRYLIQTSQEQTANGIMPAYAPLAKDDYMIILGSNCLWIRGLRNYLLYSGDEKTVRELLPAAQKMMELLHSYTNADGLMDNPPYAYWLDHSVNDRRGANLTINGHYWGALTDYAELLSWLNIDGGEVFTKRAESLKGSIQFFWDNEKQLFADALIDGKRSPMFSEHGNAMALATGAATTEQAKLVAEQLLADDNHDYMKRENGMIMVTPAMSYFLHKGLSDYGYVDESFSLFRRRFDMMLDESTNQTLWEEWWLDGSGRTGKFMGGRTRSDAQTESAFPPALFAEYLLGLKVTQPGMREIEISCPDSEIKNINADVPTPLGNLNIEWNFDKNNGGELLVDVQEEMELKVNLDSFKAKKIASFILDGKTIETQNSTVILKNGKHSIRF